MGILLWIIFGAIAGWLASIIVGSKGGIITNAILGIIGAVVGSYVMQFLGYSDVTGFNLYSLGVAILGAVIVVAIARAIA